MDLNKKLKASDIIDGVTFLAMSAFILYTFWFQYAFTGIGLPYAVLGVMMAVLFCMRLHLNWRFYKSIYFIIAFLFCCTVATLLSANMAESVSWVVKITLYILPMICLYNYVGTNKKRLNNIMVVFLIAILGITLTLLLIGEYNKNDALVLGDLNPNAFSNFLLLGLIANVWCLNFSKSKFVKFLIIAIIIVEFIAQVLSSSRRGLVVFIFIIGAYLFTIYTTRYKTNVKLWVFTIGVVAIVGMLLLTHLEELAERFSVLQKFTNELGQHSNNTRHRYQDVAWKMFEKSPIFGKGLGAVAQKIGLYSHSLYYELLACVGIVGAGCVLLPLMSMALNFLFPPANKGLKVQDKIGIKMTAWHIVALLISGIAVVYIYEISFYIELALCCSIMHVYLQN